MRVGRGARSGWGWPVQRAGRKARSEPWRPASEQKGEQVQRPVRLQPLWVFEICKKAGVAGAQPVSGGQGGGGWDGVERSVRDRVRGEAGPEHAEWMRMWEV